VVILVSGQCNCFVTSGYVINHRCLFVCLFVCPLATLRKNVRTDLHEIFREGWQWAMDKWLNFGGDPQPDPYIATLVGRALAEVCTVRGDSSLNSRGCPEMKLDATVRQF